MLIYLSCPGQILYYKVLISALKIACRSLHRSGRFVLPLLVYIPEQPPPPPPPGEYHCLWEYRRQYGFEAIWPCFLTQYKPPTTPPLPPYPPLPPPQFNSQNHAI